MTLQLEGDGSFPELKGKKIHELKSFTLTSLEGGMRSGLPSVAIVTELEDGSFVFLETSLRMFLTAADALKVRHGDPR